MAIPLLFVIVVNPERIMGNWDREQKEKEFQLISGERRFRAAQLANLENIPAFIRIANDQEMLEMALVENIQRENLNPIEVALSYQRLIEEIRLTQEECSKRVGKKRSTVTNFLRLLKLPEIIQKGLNNGVISNGHARSLLSIKLQESQINLYFSRQKKMSAEGNKQSCCFNYHELWSF